MNEPEVPSDVKAMAALVVGIVSFALFVGIGLQWSLDNRLNSVKCPAGSQPTIAYNYANNPEAMNLHTVCWPPRVYTGKTPAPGSWDKFYWYPIDHTAPSIVQPSPTPTGYIVPVEYHFKETPPPCSLFLNPLDGKDAHCVNRGKS